MMHPKVLPVFRNFCTSSTNVAGKTIFDMPCPKGISIFGTQLGLITSGGGFRLHEYIDKRHKQLGMIFRERMSSTDIVFVSNPNLIRSVFQQEGKYPAHILPEPWIVYNKKYNKKRGLFFMEGEEWFQHRKIMNQHLLKESSEVWLLPPIRNVVNDFVERLEKQVKMQCVVKDLEMNLYRLSIDVIIAILVGNLETAPKKSKFYDDLLGQFSYAVRNIFLNTAKLYVLPVSLYASMNFKAWIEFKESVDASLHLAHKIVKEIYNMGSAAESGLIGLISKENISKDNLASIVADFVIAAGDTTSHTLLWTLYLLAKNPNVCEEIRGNYEIIKFVIKESMRLYPVAPFLTRIVENSVILDEYNISSRTPIAASIYTSGRSEEHFSKANLFLPYRWNRLDPRKADLAAHTPSATLPFAMGVRSCIGRKIAMLQMQETIKMVVNKFDLKLLNNSEVKAITSLVLVPKETIKIAFHQKR